MRPREVSRNPSPFTQSACDLCVGVRDLLTSFFAYVQHQGATMRLAATCIVVIATLISAFPTSSDASWRHWGCHPRTRIYTNYYRPYYRPYVSYSVRIPACRPYCRPSYCRPYVVRPYSCLPRVSSYYSFGYAPIYAPAYSVGFGLSGVYSVTGIPAVSRTQTLLQRYQRTTPLLPAAPVAPAIPAAPAVPVVPARTQPQVPIQVRSGPNAAALQLANKYINYGDRLFGEQRYQEALSRYKTAVLAAPAHPEAHFRKAHALVTVNQPALALKAFDRGYQLLGNKQRKAFQLDDIYQDNRSAKIAHMERLAKAAIDNPADAKPLLLLGLALHYDGEPERAQKFFARALTMTTGYDAVAIRFLADEPQQNPVVEARATSEF